MICLPQRAKLIAPAYADIEDFALTPSVEGEEREGHDPTIDEELSIMAKVLCVLYDDPEDG